MAKLIMSIDVAGEGMSLEVSNRAVVAQLVRLLEDGRNGRNLGGHVVAYLADAPANATVTIGAQPSNDQVITIAGVTLTAKTTPDADEEGEFARGGSAAGAATALGAAVNAHSVLANLMTATVASAVVTLAAKVPLVGGIVTTLASTTLLQFAHDTGARAGSVAH